MEYTDIRPDCTVEELDAIYERVRRFIKNTPVAELRKILLSMVESDGQLLYEFDRWAGKEKDACGYEMYLRELEVIERKWSMPQNYLPYPASENFFMAVWTLLEKRVSQLLFQKKPDDAFRAVNATWMKTDDWEVDGGYGEYDELFENVSSEWWTIAEKTDRDFRMRMRKVMTENMTKWPDGIGQDEYVESFLDSPVMKDSIV